MIQNNFHKILPPFIKDLEIQKVIDDLLLQNQEVKLPIEPDLIAEKLGFTIIPKSNMFRKTSVEAFLIFQKKEIYIDLERYQDDRYWFRCKFSLAHELGHYYLHGDLYKQLHFKTVEDWFEFQNKVPENTIYWIEKHAHEFAGRLLVPGKLLKNELQSIVSSKSYHEIAFNDLSDKVDYLSSMLQRKFEVNKEVIRIRIEKENLYPV